MSATAAQIARIRRLVDEPTGDNGYTDAVIAEYIETYPGPDERGEAPYTWDTSTQPPSKETNESWIPTYDLQAAAADIWEEKAATLAEDYDFTADGGNYSRAQAYANYMTKARYHRARRKMGTHQLHVDPPPDSAAKILINWG